MTQQASLPKGFTLRSQGGSTFLEIDLSHYDYEGIRQFAQAVSEIHGYEQKARRTPWKGRRPPRHHPSGNHKKGRQHRPASH
jgi:hypothetical protein